MVAEERKAGGGCGMSDILVFGPLGTEILIGAQRYEVIVRGEAGQTTWRSKCEVCWTPIFVSSRDGKLPVTKRCAAHRVKAAHPAIPVSGAERQGMVADIQSRLRPGMARGKDFLPLPDVPEKAPELLPGSDAPIPYYDDPDPAVVAEDDGARPVDYSAAALLAQLESMAQDDGDPDDDPAVPHETGDDMWGQRLQMFMSNRMWLPDWGPRPDQEGCKAPEHLLDALRG
jgi:hypothetical protein